MRPGENLIQELVESISLPSVLPCNIPFVFIEHLLCARSVPHSSWKMNITVCGDMKCQLPKEAFPDQRSKSHSNTHTHIAPHAHTPHPKTHSPPNPTRITHTHPTPPTHSPTYTNTHSHVCCSVTLYPLMWLYFHHGTCYPRHLIC